MARKQMTQAEKASNLRARAEKIENGEVIEKTIIQLPLADYLRNDDGVLKVIKFPTLAKNVQYFVHVQRGESKYKVFLKPSKAGSGLPIPAIGAVQPVVEFPDGASWKDSRPSYFGTVTTVSEDRQGANLVIGLLAKDHAKLVRDLAEREAQLLEFSKKVEPKTAKK